MIFSYLLNMQSHPSWVCGLKHNSFVLKFSRCKVTPFVGVWIETSAGCDTLLRQGVTPFVGVWIETPAVATDGALASCHTLRGCVD